MSKAIDDVMAERQKQISKGYDAAYDDDVYVVREMSEAACAYAAHGAAAPMSLVMHLYPWCPSTIRIGTHRESLVKAAALLIADIERMDRAEKDDSK